MVRAFDLTARLALPVDWWPNICSALMAQRAKSGGRWPVESIGKLTEVRNLIGGPSNLLLIAADASEPTSLKAMAENANVIISTVGPYQLYGEGLVAACAAAGARARCRC